MASRIWDNLKRRVGERLRELEQDDRFRAAVENLPNLLSRQLPLAITPESLMAAQYYALAPFAKMGNERLREVHTSLSGYHEATALLAATGQSVADFYADSFLLMEEVRTMHEKGWTIRELLHERPDVILAPLLRMFVTTN